jgi:hypothetical protein
MSLVKRSKGTGKVMTVSTVVIHIISGTSGTKKQYTSSLQ